MQKVFRIIHEIGVLGGTFPLNHKFDAFGFNQLKFLGQIMKNTSHFVLWVTVLTIALFTMLLPIQAQTEWVEIKRGSGTLDGGNPSWIFFKVDLSAYSSGSLAAHISVEKGTGISQTGDKCWGGAQLAEEGFFDPENKKPYMSNIITRILQPNNTTKMGRDFSKPTKFILGVISSCQPELSSKFEYVIYIKNGEKVGNQPFEISATSFCKLSGINSASPQKDEDAFGDREFNGKSYQYKIAADKNKLNQNNRLIFVNGIDTKLKDARFTALEIARIAERPIEMVYNNSSKKVAIKNTYDNYRGDMIRWAKLNALNNPPAADTLAHLILERLSKNEKVDIVAYSQGAAITAEALRLVKKCLTNNKKALEAMSNIRILTIGGAAGVDDFPKNVYVSSFAHKSDKISIIFGDNPLLNMNPDFDFVTQHTNYFKKETDTNFKGDSKAALLLKKWSKGADFDEILDDF